jgi:hypothetical protein
MGADERAGFPHERLDWKRLEGKQMTPQLFGASEIVNDRPWLGNMDGPTFNHAGDALWTKLGRVIPYRQFKAVDGSQVQSEVRFKALSYLLIVFLG